MELASSTENVPIFETIDGSLMFSVSALQMMANNTYGTHSCSSLQYIQGSYIF